jgi:hypothetical protein
MASQSIALSCVRMQNQGGKISFDLPKARSEDGSLDVRSLKLLVDTSAASEFDRF